jgi:hypothetical protein
LQFDPDRRPSSWLAVQTPFPSRFSIRFVGTASEVFPRGERPADEVLIDYRKLPPGVVVVSDPPSDDRTLAGLFASTVRSPPQGTELSGPALSALAVGPSFEGVRVERLEVREDEIDLELVYVPATKGGRRMIRVPLLLPAGAYRLRATWLGRDREPTVTACRLTVVEGPSTLHPIQSDHAEFRAWADARRSLPADGEPQSLHAGLSIVNRGPAPMEIVPRGLTVCGAGPSRFENDPDRFWFRDGSASLDASLPVRLAGGESLLLLARYEIGRADGGYRLRPAGVEPDRGLLESHGTLRAGRHRLDLQYAGWPPPPRRSWFFRHGWDAADGEKPGTVYVPEVEFEVTADLGGDERGPPPIHAREP